MLDLNYSVCLPIHFSHGFGPLCPTSCVICLDLNSVDLYLLLILAMRRPSSLQCCLTSVLASVSGALIRCVKISHSVLQI